MPRTVAEAFGPEVADELAKWAIDALVHGELPERQNATAYAAKLPWSVVHEGRGILERAGIDWRELWRRQHADFRERAARADDARRERQVAEQQGRS